MEIPASGRLFMGHRHVARIAYTSENKRRALSLSSRSIVHEPHDRPAGTTITGRPFTFLRSLPWSPMAIVSGAYCGFAYPCCSRCERRKTGGKGTRENSITIRGSVLYINLDITLGDKYVSLAKSD